MNKPNTDIDTHTEAISDQGAALLHVILNMIVAVRSNGLQPTHLHLNTTVYNALCDHYDAPSLSTLFGTPVIQAGPDAFPIALESKLA